MIRLGIDKKRETGWKSLNVKWGNSAITVVNTDVDISL